MKNQIQPQKPNLPKFQKRLLTNILPQILGRFEDFLFPPLCIICDEPRNNNPWFCPKCLTHIQQNNSSRQRCPRCSLNAKFRKCACEVAWEYPFESIYSFLDYDEIVQKIMHNIKYFNKKHLAFYIGALLSDTTPPSLFKDIDLIIPIPLHWLRKQKRGYNQAEWFARGVASKQKQLSLFTTGLIRKKRTKTQVKLNREHRAENVKNVFGVKENAQSLIRGKSVILVDDVITTGATTASCATTLLNAGCRLVKVLSLARD